MENNSTFNLPPQSVVPLGTSAPVVGTGKALGLTDGTNNAGLSTYTGSIGNNLQAYREQYGQTLPGVGPSSPKFINTTTHTGLGITTDPTKSGLKTDLTSATGAQAIVCIKY